VPNILALAFLDPHELAASLPKRMGLFKEGLLPIRGPRAGADDPDDDTAYRQLFDTSKWVELRSYLGRIKRLGDATGGIDFGKIGLEIIPPDTCLPWERNATPYSVRFQRMIVSLRTNPGVVIHSGIEAVSPQIGWLTLINQRAWNSRANMGDSSSIQLVVDFAKKTEEKD